MCAREMECAAKTQGCARASKGSQVRYVTSLAHTPNATVTAIVARAGLARANARASQTMCGITPVATRFATAAFTATASIHRVFASVILDTRALTARYAMMGSGTLPPAPRLALTATQQDMSAHVGWAGEACRVMCSALKLKMDSAMGRECAAGQQVNASARLGGEAKSAHAARRHARRQTLSRHAMTRRLNAYACRGESVTTAPSVGRDILERPAQAPASVRVTEGAPSITVSVNVSAMISEGIGLAARARNAPTDTSAHGAIKSRTLSRC